MGKAAFSIVQPGFRLLAVLPLAFGEDQERQAREKQKEMQSKEQELENDAAHRQSIDEEKSDGPVMIYKDLK